jgi:hypothetical protein
MFKFSVGVYLYHFPFVGTPLFPFVNPHKRGGTVPFSLVNGGAVVVEFKATAIALAQSDCATIIEVLKNKIKRSTVFFINWFLILY